MTLNKAFVAGLACAVGVCAFAAVEGNNTAVVIRKDAVVSTTGWQYLAVPVRGFDITGQGNVKGIALADVLPPAMYEADTQLTIENNATDTGYLTDGTYTLGTVENAPAWVLDGVNVGTQLIAANARIWVKLPSEQSPANGLASLMGVASATSADAATAPAETIFAGEQNDVDFLVPKQVSGMVAFGNASSNVVEIPHKDTTGTVITATGATQLSQNPQSGDQLLRIGNERTSYVYYTYRVTPEGTGYWLCTVKEDKFASQNLVIKPYEIAPGEAFYYYRAAAAN